MPDTNAISLAKYMAANELTYKILLGGIGNLE